MFELNNRQRSSTKLMYCTDCYTVTLWTPIELCSTRFFMCNSCGNLISEANARVSKSALCLIPEKGNGRLMWSIISNIVGRVCYIIKREFG